MTTEISFSVLMTSNVWNAIDRDIKKNYKKKNILCVCVCVCVCEPDLIFQLVRNVNWQPGIFNPKIIPAYQHPTYRLAILIF